MSRFLEKLADAKVFLEDRSAYILVALGVVLGGAGFLTLALDTPLFSIMALFLGFSLTITGLLTKVGLFTSESSLKGKVSSLFLLSAVFLVSGAMAVCLKVDLVRMWVPGMGAANPLHHNVHFEVAYPLVVFFAPSDGCWTALLRDRHCVEVLA